MDENLNTQTLEDKVEQRPDKATSKTFTQSEVDQMISIAINKKVDNYKDYDTIKQEREALLAEKKEQEMAEKTEVEKLQALLSEATTELTTVKSSLSTYQQKQLKTDILNSTKYMNMPRAYKNMVKLSSDKDEIMASAEEALKEYEQDTGKKISETFGIPEQTNTEITQPKVVDNPDGLAAALRSKVKSLVSNSGRG